MPRYEVITNQELPDSAKTELAREFTEIHCAVTGAPPSFVHVVFATTGMDNTFIGGERRPETAVRGFVRAGRDHQTIRKLLAELSAQVHRVTEVPEAEIVVWVVEVPGSRIMEGGRVLPEPGDEEAWLHAV